MQLLTDMERVNQTRAALDNLAEWRVRLATALADPHSPASECANIAHHLKMAIEQCRRLTDADVRVYIDVDDGEGGEQLEDIRL